MAVIPLPVGLILGLLGINPSSSQCYFFLCKCQFCVTYFHSRLSQHYPVFWTVSLPFTNKFEREIAMELSAHPSSCSFFRCSICHMFEVSISCQTIHPISFKLGRCICYQMVNSLLVGLPDLINFWSCFTEFQVAWPLDFLSSFRIFPDKSLRPLSSNLLGAFILGLPKLDQLLVTLHWVLNIFWPLMVKGSLHISRQTTHGIELRLLYLWLVDLFLHISRQTTCIEAQMWLVHLVCDSPGMIHFWSYSTEFLLLTGLWLLQQFQLISEKKNYSLPLLQTW